VNLKMSIENMSLLNLKEMERDIPGLSGFPSRLLAKTYNDFITVLYKDIDSAISYIQENPEIRVNDTEDRLTIDIIGSLRCFGYNVTHDTKIGGHADIVVRKAEFIWIGEAKIYKGCEYVWQGFLQLTTRYSIGDSNQKDGGMLIYIKTHNNARSVMEGWEKHLREKNLSQYSHRSCESKDNCFFSSHEHDKSGNPFQVRHMPIMLYFSPQDKSGLSSKRKS
jgi:hypothetical protein